MDAGMITVFVIMIILSAVMGLLVGYHWGFAAGNTDINAYSTSRPELIEETPGATDRELITEFVTRAR